MRIILREIELKHPKLLDKVKVSSNNIGKLNLPTKNK